MADASALLKMKVVGPAEHAWNLRNAERRSPNEYDTENERDQEKLQQ